MNKQNRHINNIIYKIATIGFWFVIYKELKMKNEEVKISKFELEKLRKAQAAYQEQLQKNAERLDNARRKRTLRVNALITFALQHRQLFEDFVAKNGLTGKNEIRLKHITTPRGDHWQADIV